MPETTKQVESTHTPGPWSSNLRDLRDDEIEYRIKAKATLVAELNNSETSTEETEANARLIAAAPDLYEACKAYIRMLNDPSDAMIEHGILKAIDKAEGR